MEVLTLECWEQWHYWNSRFKEVYEDAYNQAKKYQKDLASGADTTNWNQHVLEEQAQKMKHKEAGSSR